MKVMFGEYIRELRTNNHLTLTQLAARLELDSANLSKIENGKRDFDERRLEKLADVFNLDIEKLKVEYFSDQFAKKMVKYNCLPEALNVAKEKINYMRNMNVKQTEIEF
ncbi:helix-turn-helix domain-containing protein [Chryseobacterium oncorhynchi]|uniref:Transcriptional regulator n=1 Tax=Chryseobacterium oncorhynchi TaxID=741074 RepID=A0A316WZD7_9FLAO|nr:helix-turn-helix transcriptional regulator [Chryseobacterium oncorhynchi]PWN64348.1 transcriptional regulator [Chryseobacterium oncorhynchi]